jgi:hypothetical protein
VKTSRLIRGLALAFTLIAIANTAPCAASADREFQAIVDKLSSHYQKKPIRFMGLLSFIANRVKPEGASGLKLAIFEDLNPDRQLRGEGVDAFIQSAAAQGKFQQFLRVQSKKDGEQTYVYARETGGRFEMLIVSMEKDEAVVMKMRIKHEAMAEWIDSPVSKGKSGL